jgi:hypothetical protein
MQSSGQPDRPRRRRIRRPSAPMILAMLALIVALGGTSAADQVAHVAKVIITGSNIKNGTITGKKIKKHSLGSGVFAAGVLPNVSKFLTQTAADKRYVNDLGNNTAPNSAALQGHPAADFLTQSQADARYVNGLGNNKAPNSAQLDGLTSDQYVKGQDGLTRITRLVLDPGTPATGLLSIPNIGSFTVTCSAASADGAVLTFAKDATADGVGLVTDRTVEPDGVTANSSSALTSNLLDAAHPNHTFEAATGVGGQGRYSLQLSRVTAGKHWLATVTVSLLYKDKATGSSAGINPTKCTAFAQFVENSEPAS